METNYTRPKKSWRLKLKARINLWVEPTAEILSECSTNSPSFTNWTGLDVLRDLRSVPEAACNRPVLRRRDRPRREDHTVESRLASVGDELEVGAGGAQLAR